MILKRIFGIILIIGAVGGILLSLTGLVEIWRFRPVVTKTVVENLALVDSTLNTTQAALTMVGQVVQTTTVDVTALQTTSAALAQAIQDTDPSFDSMIGLTSKDLPAAVNATQTSLTSAQSSALLIDNALSALTNIPFLPVAAYTPVVPLHTALAQIKASLNSLEPALTAINTSLVNDKTNMGIVEAGLAQIADTTQGMGSTLTNAHTVIDQYLATTTQLKTNVETAHRNASAWITAITVILSLVLGWLVIAQLGLGMQGLNLMRSNSK